jgi:hypothetical protein
MGKYLSRVLNKYRENTGELLKLEKLLDKTEYELKRKRTFQVLANADKYIDHLTKVWQ